MSRTMSDGTTISPQDIDDALFRALREPMLVYEDHPDTRGEHEIVVYSESREYLVNIDVEFCPCPAFMYHCEDDEDCKHLQRAKLALGERDVPEWVNMDAVDGELRRRLEVDR